MKKSLSAIILLLGMIGCMTGRASQLPGEPNPTAQAGNAQTTIPQANHVIIVLEENHSYEQVIGNSTMPYLNSLANAYGLATQSYANGHYSIGNYMFLAAGQAVTKNDNTTAKFSVDNITPYLLTAGKTWKEYAEGLPSAGYVGYNTGEYAERHNPFPYFNDIALSSERFNIVPFTQFATDLANGNLPNYSFITPNLLDDAHSATLGAADVWLKSHIAPLLASPGFQAGGHDILIITFDEAVNSDCRPATSCTALPNYNNDGGRVATIVIGQDVKRGYKSTTRYFHPSVTRTMLDALGITGGPAAIATAPTMADFFGSGGTPPPPPPPPPPTTTGAVTIISPLAGSVQVTNTFIVGAKFNKTAQYMKLWIDGVAKLTVRSTNILSTYVTLAKGLHRITVQAYNGTLYHTTEYVTVQ